MTQNQWMPNCQKKVYCTDLLLRWLYSWQCKTVVTVLQPSGTPFLKIHFWNGTVRQQPSGCHVFKQPGTWAFHSLLLPFLRIKGCFCLQYGPKKKKWENKAQFTSSFCSLGTNKRKSSIFREEIPKQLQSTSFPQVPPPDSNSNIQGWEKKGEKEETRSIDQFRVLQTEVLRMKNK